jgi:mono/diheme cytochrome c family protein
MVNKSRKPPKPQIFEQTIRLALIVCASFTAGCRNDMYDQPRYEPFQSSTFFDDGASARLPIPGTVARGHLDIDEHLHSGKVDGKDAATFPFPIDRAGLDRGRERYNIYCLPCHGALGDGRGMIVRRGFSPPPSFHESKGSLPTGSPIPIYNDLRTAPPGHFFEVITEGHGTMYSYAARIAVADRWKIVAYIRALQLSRHATLDELATLPAPNDEERTLLREGGR